MSLEKYNRPSLFAKIFASWGITVGILALSMVLGPMIVGYENYDHYIGENLMVISLVLAAVLFPLVNKRLK